MKILIFVALFLMPFLLPAQDKISIEESDYTNEKIEMADGFRADGKIYVVVAVITIILAGMFTYVIRIDTRLSKLEREALVNSRKSQSPLQSSDDSTA